MLTPSYTLLYSCLFTGSPSFLPSVSESGPAACNRNAAPGVKTHEMHVCPNTKTPVVGSSGPGLMRVLSDASRHPGPSLLRLCPPSVLGFSPCTWYPRDTRQLLHVHHGWNGSVTGRKKGSEWLEGIATRGTRTLAGCTCCSVFALPGSELSFEIEMAQSLGGTQ